MALNYANMGPIFSLRSEMEYTELEKRQLFLRSYQFSRKQSLGERMRRSFFRVRKVLWGPFRSARKLRKILWLKLKNGVVFTSRRRRLNYQRFSARTTSSSQSSSCFW